MTIISKEDCAAAVEACACFNFRKASRAVTQLYNNALQPSGLRSTQFVLLAVVHTEEPVALPRLAKELVLERSTLTRNLKPLERAGLVKVVRGAGRQGTVVRLTAKGRRTLSSAVPLWEKAQAAFVQALGGGRWETLRKSLAAAVRAP